MAPQHGPDSNSRLFCCAVQREMRIQNSSFHKAMGMVGADAIYERRLGHDDRPFNPLGDILNANMVKRPRNTHTPPNSTTNPHYSNSSFATLLVRRP